MAARRPRPPACARARGGVQGTGSAARHGARSGLAHAGARQESRFQRGAPAATSAPCATARAAPKQAPTAPSTQGTTAGARITAEEGGARAAASASIRPEALAAAARPPAAAAAVRAAPFQR